MFWKRENSLTPNINPAPAIQPVAIPTEQMPSVASFTPLAVGGILVIVHVMI
jgi:hypothetical protein